ncbi:hypothetical protein MHYP_G00011540 [Metynnis hypsauchen]
MMGSNVDMARWSSGILLMFLLDLVGVAATNMEPIYWNSLNKSPAQLLQHTRCSAFGKTELSRLRPRARTCLAQRLKAACPSEDQLGARV